MHAGAGVPVRQSATPLVLMPSVPAAERAAANPQIHPHRLPTKPTDANCTAPRAAGSWPISPDVSQASTRSTIESLYCGVKRSLVAFAEPPGPARLARLACLLPPRRAFPFISIPSPGPILHLSALAYSNPFLLSCLACVGREGLSGRAQAATGGIWSHSGT